MPIINKSRYPKNWREISRERKEAVGWKCELCGEEKGKPKPAIRLAQPGEKRYNQSRETCGR